MPILTILSMNSSQRAGVRTPSPEAQYHEKICCLSSKRRAGQPPRLMNSPGAISSRVADRTLDFEKILSCLVEGNRAWAREAPILALGCIRKTFSRNDMPNRVAQHDLGLASASLTFEATSRGVYVHQMAGILPEKAREIFTIPEAFEAVTALALGYRASPGTGVRELHTRDERVRTRRPLREFVFGANWAEPGLESAH